MEGTKMNSSINRVALRPARVLVLVGLLATMSVACTAAASTGRGGATGAPTPDAPSGAPASQPSAPIHVELKDEFDSGATVDIVDHSGTIVSARAAEIGEREPDPAAPSSGDVTVQNVDAATLWISWAGGNCPDAHVLTIDAAGTSISISQPPFCGGDTVGVGRALVVTFAEPIAAADVAAEIVATGASPSPGP
jgi:hypothetical protein